MLELKLICILTTCTKYRVWSQSEETGINCQINWTVKWIQCQRRFSLGLPSLLPFSLGSQNSNSLHLAPNCWRSELNFICSIAWVCLFPSHRWNRWWLIQYLGVRDGGHLIHDYPLISRCRWQCVCVWWLLHRKSNVSCFSGKETFTNFSILPAQLNTLTAKS